MSEAEFLAIACCLMTGQAHQTASLYRNASVSLSSASILRSLPPEPRLGEKGSISLAAQHRNQVP